MATGRAPTLPDKTITGNPAMDRFIEKLRAALKPVFDNPLLASKLFRFNESSAGLVLQYNNGGTTGWTTIATFASSGALSTAISKSLLTTIGDMIYASAASTPARLASGTSGYVLTANGAGVAPSWQAVPAATRRTADSAAYLSWTLNETSLPFANGIAAQGSNGNIDTQNSTGATLGALGFFADAASSQNGAIRFVGSAQQGYTASNSGSLSPGGSTSQTVWVFPISFGAGTTVEFFYKAYRPIGTWTAPYISHNLGLYDNTGRIYGSVAISAAEKTAASGSDDKLQLGLWNLMAVTYDGANIKLYLNGSLVATTAQTGSIDYGTSGRWGIGMSPDNAGSGSLWKGYMDDPRVWPSALSAANIATMWRNGVGYT